MLTENKHDTGDVVINYVEAGEGDPIVFLHGLSLDWRSWSREIGTFAHRWRLVASDAQGHGGSSRARNGDYGYDRSMGNMGQVSAHFEDAMAFCRRAGYRPELAWTCHDYADMLLERNSPTDQYTAKALLDESLAISRELGMKPLMERVLSRREILGA